MPNLSVVIPAHNERQSLPPLLDELAEVLSSLDDNYEVIVVDDGSTDGTAEALDAIRATSPALRVIELDGNYGQSTAFEAGFRAARGDVIVTLDADGQNPPAEIPKLIEKIGPFDFVCGWRRQRRDPLLKRLASRLANAVRRAVLHDAIHDTGCSLKAMRRECVENLPLYRGMHRFMPALVKMRGFRVTEVEVDHRARKAGRSHYGILNRTLGPLNDLRGVRWMQRRCRPYRAKERPPASSDTGGSSANATSGRHPDSQPHCFTAVGSQILGF